ncbi:MAG TPA: EAL domain-containing protein [Clostridiales bacterium]|nr:EAL domain-containing protein [Clostridiales bacterium]
MPFKILLVDESKSDRLIIENLLSEEHEILLACDVKEAMRILNEHDGINLLMLDLDMPGMNGYEVLEALKDDERFLKLRTIVLTDNLEPDNEIMCLKLGAVDCIRKPIYRDLLKAKIDLHATLIRAEQALEQKLDEQAFTFDMIFNQAPIGIAITQNTGEDRFRPEKVVIRANPVYERIVGRTKDEILSLGWESITHPDDLEEDLRNFKRLQAGEIKSYSMDKRYIKPDGSIVWVHMVVAPFDLANNQDCNYRYNHICLIQDITERKKIEEALMESERSKSVFLSHLPGLAYRCNYDREWTMQYVSKGCYNLTGYNAESLLYNRDLSYNDLISPEYRESLWNEWARVLPLRQQFKYEYEIITASGEKKWVLELGQGVYNEQGEVEALEGIVIDISDRKAIETALKYNNEHDRWTGLYNRDYLESLMKKEAELRKNVKKAFVGVNLSTVQILTANYGFQYTQNVIKKAAEMLDRYSSGRRMLFNTYQNRFVFYIVDYKDKNELIEFAKTIADALESLFLMERIGGGIGILEIDEADGEPDLDLLLRHLMVASERAISVEKDFGICFYDERLEALVNRETDIVEALNAIAAGGSTDEQLLLQYQPVVNIRTGAVCGFEALARLKTEKLGLVLPFEFIPIAEKTKLILNIGEKVIISAFRFLNKLKEHGYDDVGVSINISVLQLLHPDFADKLFELISEMQVNPGNVCIEITESVFASDYESINKHLERLRDAGMHVAIDDFGTGYSSLAREKELKVDFMKIDKYFIDKLMVEDLDESITSDIISISRKLGHCIIAEGVEHEEQLNYLKENNCDRIQGYIISEPLDEEEAIEFLKSRSQA